MLKKVTLLFGGVIFYLYIAITLKQYTMNKGQVLEKIKSMDKNNLDKQKILALITTMEGSVASKKPNTFKKGDVLMHPVFRHPYVLLEYKDNQWICALLTTESECAEILEPCKSRFFPDSFFTKVMFTVQEPIGVFANVFENTRQINSILTQLKTIFS